jgi:glycosyltransferase involved in cell wall biosynthesis
MKKKSILHIQLLPILSGVQNVSITEIAGLKEFFDFEMICSAKGPLVEEMARLSVPVMVLNKLKREISPVNDIIAFFQLRNIIKKNEYDVVHTHSSKPGFLGRIAAKSVGVPLVIHTVHGFSFGNARSKLNYAIYYFLELIASRFTDFIIVMNEADRLFCIRKLKISERRVVFLANGIRDSLFCSEKNNSIYGIPAEINHAIRIADPFKILFVGRLWPQKNPLLLLSALGILKEKVGPIFKASIIGDGELMSHARRFAVELGIDEQVEFFGWVKDAVNLMPNHDAFVLPSIYEGMPLSIIEAMASKVPVVASKTSGNTDLIRHLENGLLFESESADDLADKLQMLINNPILADDLSCRAHIEASSKYKASQHCHNLKKIYKKDADLL